MAIARYEPWSLLNQLHKELDRVREGGDSEGSTATAEWRQRSISRKKPTSSPLADLGGKT